MSVDKIAIEVTSTGTPTPSSPEAPLDRFHEWLAESETHLPLRRCAEATIAVLKANPRLRVPRAQEERADGFSRWLNTWQAALGPVMETQLREQLVGVPAQLTADEVASVVRQQVWPLVEPVLLSYAVRGLAHSWISRNIGDAITMDDPERQADGWVVPLRVKGRGEIVGVAALDREGNIVPERTSTRDSILARIRYVHRKIERGLQDLRDGRVLTREGMEQRFAQWLK